MNYCSILFKNEQTKNVVSNSSMPYYFTDLNLDQIASSITDGKEKYNLMPYFYSPLTDLASIKYRQDVFRDLENSELLAALASFTHSLNRVEDYVKYSKDLPLDAQDAIYCLDAMHLYCTALLSLLDSLNNSTLNSEALTHLSNYIAEYASSNDFMNIKNLAFTIKRELEAIRYTLVIENDKVKLSFDDNSDNYFKEIFNVFTRFDFLGNDYDMSAFQSITMSNLEAEILSIISKEYKSTFNKLDKFYKDYKDYDYAFSKAIVSEIQFYVSILEFINPLQNFGLPLCLPDVSDSKAISIDDGYDLALAYKLYKTGSKVITNDLFLTDNERVFVISGPNQGGKTTFARSFGQIMYLAVLGCPVPARRASTYLFDHIFTHFSVEEDLTTNSGRLKEELTRLNEIMQSVTPNSVFIINELFATTTSYDAYLMGKRILNTLCSLDTICIYVTHIFELYNVNDKIVSLISIIEKENNSKRTYKILRKPADGLVYANVIVNKYRLNSSSLEARMKEKEAKHNETISTI